MHPRFEPAMPIAHYTIGSRTTFTMPEAYSPAAPACVRPSHTPSQRRHLCDSVYVLHQGPRSKICTTGPMDHTRVQSPAATATPPGKEPRFSNRSSSFSATHATLVTLLCSYRRACAGLVHFFSGPCLHDACRRYIQCCKWGVHGSTFAEHRRVLVVSTGRIVLDWRCRCDRGLLGWRQSVGHVRPVPSRVLLQ